MMSRKEYVFPFSIEWVSYDIGLGDGGLGWGWVAFRVVSASRASILLESVGSVVGRTRTALASSLPDH